MRKYVLLSTCLFLASTAFSQSDSLKWVREINEQVWKPFTAYISSGDDAGLSNLHSKRVTRVGIDGSYIMDYDKYFPSGKEKPKPQEKRDLVFELRFDKRISNGSKAWETGYYKGMVKREGKQPITYYGRFFVVLEKEEGSWKILVDADTSKGVTEEDFARAASME